MKAAIFGTGQNSFQAFHILRHSPGVQVVAFLDERPQPAGATHLGLPVVSGSDAMAVAREQHGVAAALVAIGDNFVRERLTRELRDHGFALLQAIHPQAMIDAPTHLGEGIIVEMGACIHPGATVGNGVFIGGSAVVSHHSRVGDFALLGGGVIFGGHVTVGDRALIGVGAVLQPHVTIGAESVVGIGAAVVKDLPPRVVAVGVPARIIKQLAAEDFAR